MRLSRSTLNDEEPAQVADRFAERKTLGSLEASIRVMQLCAIAERLDPKTPHGRRARRVADMMQTAKLRYVAHHGHEPPAPRLAPPAPTAPTPFDINAELERQAQRNEHAQFDRLQAQQHHHH